MTVDYSDDVITRKRRAFLRLLFRWRGSIYKLVWPDMIVYFLAYYMLALYYKLVLSEATIGTAIGNKTVMDRRYFISFVAYARSYIHEVPISLVLAFYVTIVVNRWWSTFQTIPWPDGIALLLTTVMEGADERSRLIRRTIMRYINLSWILLFTMISPQIKLRFPTYEHLIQAGILMPHEKMILETMNVHTKCPKYWVPLGWARSLLSRARKENRITESMYLNTLVHDLAKFRIQLGELLNYDWIQVPLVYTQAVTIATYSYFIANVMAKQYLEEEDNTGFYFPIFHLLEYFFYMGLMKVAESLINPFGNDDDDFEMNYLLDRNIKVSYFIVDEMYRDLPLIRKDMYWDCYSPEMIPYTETSMKYRMRYFQGSAHHLVTKLAEHQFVTRPFKYNRARQPDPPRTEYQIEKDEELLQKRREENAKRFYPNEVLPQAQGQQKEQAQVAVYDQYENASDVDFELRCRLKNFHTPRTIKSDFYNRVALVYKIIAERKKNGSLQTSGYWGSITGPVLADNSIFYETEFNKRFVRSDQPVLYEDVELITIDASKDKDRHVHKKTFLQRWPVLRFFTKHKNSPEIL